MFGKDNLAYKNMKYIKIMGGGKYNSQLRVLEINSFVDSSFFFMLVENFLNLFIHILTQIKT